MNATFGLCEECGDAVATTGAWFNGRTWVVLCAECFEWWENHALVEAPVFWVPDTEEKP